MFVEYAELVGMLCFMMVELNQFVEGGGGGVCCGWCGYGGSGVCGGLCGYGGGGVYGSWCGYGHGGGRVGIGCWSGLGDGGLRCGVGLCQEAWCGA